MVNQYSKAAALLEKMCLNQDIAQLKANGIY